MYFPAVAPPDAYAGSGDSIGKTVTAAREELAARRKCLLDSAIASVSSDFIDR